jgi:hypothetical protein
MAKRDKTNIGAKPALVEAEAAQLKFDFIPLFRRHLVQERAHKQYEGPADIAVIVPLTEQRFNMRRQRDGDAVRGIVWVIKGGGKPR